MIVATEPFRDERAIDAAFGRVGSQHDAGIERGQSVVVVAEAVRAPTGVKIRPERLRFEVQRGAEFSERGGEIAGPQIRASEVVVFVGSAGFNRAEFRRNGKGKRRGERAEFVGQRGLRSEFGLRWDRTSNASRCAARSAAGARRTCWSAQIEGDLGEVRNKMFMCELIEPIGVATQKARVRPKAA